MKTNRMTLMVMALIFAILALECAVAVYCSGRVAVDSPLYLPSYDLVEPVPFVSFGPDNCKPSFYGPGHFGPGYLTGNYGRPGFRFGPGWGRGPVGGNGRRGR
jgi:hypothetical protein